MMSQGYPGYSNQITCKNNVEMFYIHPRSTCIRITVEMQPYCILNSVASCRVAIVSENSIAPPICIFTRCDKNEKKKTFPQTPDTWYCWRHILFLITRIYIYICMHALYIFRKERLSFRYICAICVQVDTTNSRCTIREKKKMRELWHISFISVQRWDFSIWQIEGLSISVEKYVQHVERDNAYLKKKTTR